MATRFFLCETCGNVVVKIVDSGVGVICCGKEMKELVPSTVDGFSEKHLPVVEHLDECTIKVKIGAVPHPMTHDHHILFVCLETEHGFQIRYLKPGEPAEAVFCGCKDKPLAVYAYCNIHGLWKLDAPSECEPRECGCKCK